MCIDGDKFGVLRSLFFTQQAEQCAVLLLQWHLMGRAEAAGRRAPERGSFASDPISRPMFPGFSAIYLLFIISAGHKEQTIICRSRTMYNRRSESNIGLLATPQFHDWKGESSPVRISQT